MPEFRAIRRCLAVAALVVLSVMLAGCFDKRTSITFNADGSVIIGMEVRADKEMQDVATAVEAYANYKPKGHIAKDGVCRSLEGIAKGHGGGKLTVRQFTDAKDFVCAFKLEFASVGAVEDSYFAKTKFLRIRSSGERRYMISLDLEAMRNARALIETAATAGLQSSLGINEPAEASALYRKLRGAYGAVVKMMTRNRQVVFEVRAAKVLDTNGTRAADGKSAQFRFSWSDLFDLAIGKDGAPAKSYFTELVY